MREIAEAVNDYDKENPTVKLYAKDLAGLKDIDVDNKLCLHLKVKAKSKYREDYRPGNPLCITFDITKVEKCEED